MEQKEEKIASLMHNIVGAPDERFEEKDVMIAELEEKVEDLEKALFKMKQERSTAASGISAKPKDE